MLCYHCGVKNVREYNYKLIIKTVLLLPLSFCIKSNVIRHVIYEIMGYCLIKYSNLIGVNEP